MLPHRMVSPSGAVTCTTSVDDAAAVLTVTLTVDTNADPEVSAPELLWVLDSLASVVAEKVLGL